MTVNLALFAHLSTFQPDGEGGRHGRELDLAGSSVAEVIDMLGLPDEPRVVFVNGRHAADEHLLCDGDRLAIFPPVAGG